MGIFERGPRQIFDEVFDRQTLLDSIRGRMIWIVVAERRDPTPGWNDREREVLGAYSEMHRIGLHLLELDPSTRSKPLVKANRYDECTNANYVVEGQERRYLLYEVKIDHPMQWGEILLDSERKMLLPPGSGRCIICGVVGDIASLADHGCKL